MPAKKTDPKGPFRTRVEKQLHDNATNLYKSVVTRAGGYRKTHVLKVEPPKKGGAADGR